MMFQIIFILSSFIFNVQCCELLDTITDGADTAYWSWEYLINATELVRAAINDDDTKLLKILEGRQLVDIYSTYSTASSTVCLKKGLFIFKLEFKFTQCQKFLIKNIENKSNLFLQIVY